MHFEYFAADGDSVTISWDSALFSDQQTIPQLIFTAPFHLMVPILTTRSVTRTNKQINKQQINKCYDIARY